MDNTWSTFLGCNPLEIGVNIVIESLTNIFSGHSDNFLGLVALNSLKLAKTIKKTSVRLGIICSHLKAVFKLLKD